MFAFYFTEVFVFVFSSIVFEIENLEAANLCCYDSGYIFITMLKYIVLYDCGYPSCYSIYSNKVDLKMT